MADPLLLDRPRGDASPPRQLQTSRRFPAAAVIGLAAAAACSGAYLLILQSHFTFFGDDWMFLLDRRGSSTGAFLNPHNGHIALAPVLIYKALLTLFGMDSVLPFATVSTLVFLLSVALLFVYMRRRVGDWLALLGCALILFLGAGWRDLLWSFQIAFFGSMAAGIAALLALERDDRAGDLLACGLLAVAISFSELGVPFALGALVSVAAGASRRVRLPLQLKRLYVALLPLVLYGIWYLGWGHEAASSFSLHNVVESPKWVFDAISESIVSLFGLATPSSDVTHSSHVGGLNLGRILLVLAFGLSAWRLWRTRRASRWLWVALAAGGSFWFLTAFNANIFRAPTDGRYQYPGAIFVLLIAAELLRGIRVDKRVLIPAAAVTLSAVVSGVIFLHQGYDFRREDGDNLRARLTALEIGRGHEVPHLIFAFHILIPRPASAYFAAVDAFGSPALSEEQLARSDEVDRASADQQLAKEEGITLSPVAAGLGHGVGSADRCKTLNPPQPGSTAPAIGPGSYILSERRQPAAAAGIGIAVQAARFADQPAANIGLLQPGATASLRIPPDKSNRPWRLYSPLLNAGTVCPAGPR